MRAEDFYLFGSILEGMGDRFTSRECWQEGLKLDTGHPEIIAALARSFVRAKQLDRAADFARELAARPGWEARGDFLLGTIEAEPRRPGRRGCREARWGAALARYDPSTPPGAPEPPSTYRRLLARSLLRTGKPAEAVPPLQAVLASGPDPEVSWLLSRAYLQAGRPGEAAVALKASGDYRARHETAYEPSPAVGAARCAECHPAIYTSEQTSLHARTFWRGDRLDKLPFPAAPVPDPARRGVRFAIKKEGNQVHFDARGGGQGGGGDPPGGRRVRLRLGAPRDHAGRDRRGGPGPRVPPVALRGGVGLGPDLGADGVHPARREFPRPGARARRGPELPGLPHDRPAVGARRVRADGDRPGDRLRAVPRAGRGPPQGGRGQVPRPGDRAAEAGDGRPGRRHLRGVPQPDRPRDPPPRPPGRPVPRHRPDLEPVLHRGRRRPQLRDLPRPAQGRRDRAGVL